MTSQTPRTGRVGVGLIGAGMISDTYLDNLTSFPDVEVLMVSDRDVPRAQAQAQKHGVPAWGGADDVLAHPDIELVVNLTIPAVHAQVSSAAIAAGKHVWSEKPLGITRESARQVLDDAARAGLHPGHDLGIQHRKVVKFLCHLSSGKHSRGLHRALSRVLAMAALPRPFP